MVLQRNKKIVVWGEAESSSITVKPNGVTASVTAVEGKGKLNSTHGSMHWRDAH